jgi:pimeloyl-ACP methyl ester carboxylesterase
MASLAMAERVLGDSFDLCSVRWYLRIRQESVTAEMLARLLTFWWSTEVRDLLNTVSVPTLVAHYRNNRLTQFEAGRELAAAIPGARFVPLEGDARLFFFNDTQPLLSAIAEFLGDPSKRSGGLALTLRKFHRLRRRSEASSAERGSFGPLPARVKSSD